LSGSFRRCDPVYRRNLGRFCVTVQRVFGEYYESASSGNRFHRQRFSGRAQAINYIKFIGATWQGARLKQAASAWLSRILSARGDRCGTDAHVYKIIVKPLTALKANNVRLVGWSSGLMKRRHGPRNRPMAATKQQIQHGDHAVPPMRWIKISAGWRTTRLSAFSGVKINTS
jgi:hypothetical protein